MEINTLLISADSTYPGIVHAIVNEKAVRVKWYKWGYQSPDVYDDVELIQNIAHLVKTPEQVKNRFGKLPPEYVAPAEPLVDANSVYKDIVADRISAFADDIAACAVDEYMGVDHDLSFVKKALVNYVLGLLK